jgi:pyruvate/2-oxoglutarate dehydrogenase complex dihydrolipoamide acyltransferase (E2) component
VRRVVPIAVLIVALLTLAACGGEDEAAAPTTTETQTETAPPPPPPPQPPPPPPAPAEPTTVRVIVRGGVPAGGVVRESTDKGDRVVVLVTSDVADEVHVHGYDLSRDVAPGAPARIAFPATIPGRFEIELEDRGVQIAELTVNP